MAEETIINISELQLPGSENVYTFHALQSDKLSVPITITINGTSKSFDGSKDISFSSTEIGLDSKQDKLPDGEAGQVLTAKGDGTVEWKSLKSDAELPVGYIIELDGDKDPNEIYGGNWVEI